MNVLVTGATGFIGLPLTRRLVEKGYNVRCLVRETSNTKELENLGADICIGDVEKRDTLEQAVIGVDTVYHLAGGGNVAATFKRGYTKLKRLNVVGVKNLLDACVEANVKNFILFSSVSAMGIIVEKVIDELTDLQPLTPHEVCKYKGEILIKAYKDKINYRIIRPGIVYGPRAPKSEMLLLSKLIKKGLILMPGKGNNLMPFVYVDDVVDATILIAENKTTLHKAYIVVSEREPTFSQIVNTIKKYVNPKAIVIKIPKSLVVLGSTFLERIGEVLGFEFMFNRRRAVSMSSNRIYDVSRLKSLGWSQKVDLDEGLRKAIKWYKGKNTI